MLKFRHLGGVAEWFFEVTRLEKEESQPLGILVIRESNRLCIPVCLASSFYHHALKVEGVLFLLKEEGCKFTIAEDDRRDIEANKKDPLFWEMVMMYLGCMKEERKW